MNIKDTIAAVSTPRGKGGVALLRVSGDEALSISEKVFVPKSGKKLTEYPPRTQIYGSIYDESGKEIDDGLATFFPGPRSFTGEDTVEICCHGGILLTETVLASLFSAGARPAEAGEFTRRAFVNGKMGLSTAESLGELLEAKNHSQITLAHNGMGGKKDAEMQTIYDHLAYVLSSIYAKIDYPDEDLADLSREQIHDTLQQDLQHLETLLATYRTGHAVAEGIATIICGVPNVGKSSLYNAILGKDSAIVTDIAGTTRDVLTDTVALGKVTLRLSDTAGIHDTEDKVEQIGVERAKKSLEEAELILYLVDGSRPITDEALELYNTLKQYSAHLITVITKNDLTTVAKVPAEWNTVSVSTKEKTGILPLKEKLESLFLDAELDLSTDPILTNARQFSAVKRGTDTLKEAVILLEQGEPEDLCCQMVEDAMSALSEADGRAVSEDIISSIFSHFCVGK